MVMWLPLSWAYTFTKVRERSREWQQRGCLASNPMTRHLNFRISFLTLLQFFVSYCHSLIAESRAYELSEQGREILASLAVSFGGDQFRRLLQLIAVCPEPGGDSGQVRAVSLYFWALGVGSRPVRMDPARGSWMDSNPSAVAAPT